LLDDRGDLSIAVERAAKDALNKLEGACMQAPELKQ
jgi:hypothetical protein